MQRLKFIFFYLFSIHVTGILFFTVFRLILFFVNIEHAADTENVVSYLGQALLKGLRFDNFMASYLTCLPLLALTCFAFFGKASKALISIFNIFFSVFYALFFTICIADIPYFSYFFAHIGVSAFGWFEFGNETAGLIFQTADYYPYIALLLVSITLFSFLVCYFGKRFLLCQTITEKPHYKSYVPCCLILFVICFLGMRGSFQRYPLRIGFAYFSNKSFFNQLGVNPCVFLYKDFSSASRWRNNNVNDLMDKETSFHLVQKELDRDLLQSDSLMEILSDSMPKPNVVIVLLESMAKVCLDYEYQGKNLTPYFHELIEKSYYFENFYSAAVHTNNGIVSTLSGFPALFNKPSMGSTPKHYGGLSLTLQKQGYQTLFFVTSNPNYDHMNSFLYENGFDRIYSQYDYPEEKVVSYFGVQDDYLLEFGAAQLTKTAQNNQPFLATFLTVSNHSPLFIPDAFKNTAATDDKRIIAFVDNAVRTFMENAEKQSWYKNTIFVFLGDHGGVIGKSEYDMPLNYNHIPLIIYSPLFSDAPKRFTQFGGQIDVFPTLMGLLGIPYQNNTFGIDLLKDKSRPCMYFVNDNQLGCINNNYLYVRNLTTNMDVLYNLKSNGSQNIMQQEPNIGNELKEYAVSMMVAADYLIQNKQ